MLALPIVATTLFACALLLAAGRAHAEVPVVPGAVEATGAAVDRCAVPEELLADDEALPRVALRLHHHQPVTIVAIGGASTRGAGALEKAYPARLEADLRRRFPAVPISVINRGQPHQNAEQMVARFDHDVLPDHPDLVIWETGTNDAVKMVPLDDFSAALAAGFTLLHAHNIEVVLMDMQYSRESASVINFDPYIDVMRHVAQVNVVRMFRRYDIMKFWVDTDVFGLESSGVERDRLACAVYDCIARRLGDMIVLATP